MSKKYSKKDPISHILDRSEMYVGSKKLKDVEEYVAIKNGDSFKIDKKLISSSPAILRIFIEILSNAIDNFERSRKSKTPCKTIKVSINKESGETIVWNDGEIIPIEIHEEEGVYNHSLIFGNLLTGSNYDDKEERLVSGKNGLGCKLTCVFSAKFTVKGADPNNKKTFEQTWTNNMKTTTEAIVKTLKSIKTGYTQVTYFPDFKQFGLKGYTDDIINLYTKYIIDTAMLTKVKVYLNDELINVNSLESYSRLYENPTEESLLIKNTHSEVLIMPSSIGEFQKVSFVNGIYTKLGGVHVDAFAEAIFRPIVEKFNKKDKPVINIKDVKQFFRLFVVSTVVNPDFEGQSKEKLESPKIEAVVKSTEINKILKWSVISELEDIIKMKDMAVLKKVERKSKSIKVEGLDRANLSDTKDSYKCSLILCEGLSAKTYAVAGIKKGVYGKAGRDYFGILSLTGKILNCRNSNPTSISKNAVITKLIQSLGLRHGTDYTDDKNYKSLSYGKVILLADADVDGIHITSLIINFFHYLFPSLLERKEPFICNMCTPIVRVFNSKGDLLFYDENRFRKFSEEQTRPFKSKYYKGLGTTKAEDVPDTFGKKMIEYNMDEGTNTSINKVFNKKFADTRKEWLEKYDPRPTFSLDDEGAVVDMKLSTYLNTETIKFSHDDCKRSIPSLYDGLKQSQRKILYAVKKRNLTYNKPSLKVAQLGGYVAEVSNYHHGEQNLYDTIVNMAQDYVGSNNIPLLYRDGMFGTRLANGADAASARYIFTKMEILTPLIFREEDDVLLEQVCDDGDLVEPRFYIPIIPMILVNGALGIGTGWSSTIPCYNPIDVVDAVKTWIENKGQIIEEDEDGTILSLLPELYPWYRGFKGNISQINENKFISKGVLTLNKNLIKISEIPIGMAINTFKEFLEDLKDDKKIKKFDNQSSEVDIDFTITPIDGFKCDIENLKLHSYLNISNMVCFNIKDQLKKYKLDQIINDFCIVRYDYYIKRKKHILNTLESELRHLGNKARFIGEIIDGKLNIMNVDEKIIITELEKRGYDKEQGSEDGGKGYNYLLTLHIRTFTRDKVKKLKDDIASCQLKIDGIRSTTEYKMWINDLGEFEVAYKKWVNEPEKSKKPKKK
jgi:DNA topoisomerase-2